MKVRKQMTAVVTALILALMPAAAAHAGVIPYGSSVGVGARQGWKTSASGYTYYFIDGKKATGVTKIGKKLYAFNKKGVLQKNFKIFRDGKKYYRVNSKGVATQYTGLAEKAAIRAYALSGKVNVNTANARKTLYDAFQWCVKIEYQAITEPADKSDESMANYYGTLGLVNRMGDCAVQAYTCCWLATVIGYKTKVINGYVYNSNTDTYGVHSWCEVTQGGKAYILDPNFNKEYFVKNHVEGLTVRSGFMQRYGASKTLKYATSEKELIEKNGHA